MSDCLSPWQNIAWSSPALVGPPPPGVLLAGASLPGGVRGGGEPLALDPTRPLVLMALGSRIYHQPRMFEVVIEASRGQPWQLVLAMGGLADTMPLPPGVHALAYAPQLSLLTRARAGGDLARRRQLGDGGAGPRRPLLVSPICNDQPHNARFVAAAGAGLQL